MNNGAWRWHAVERLLKNKAPLFGAEVGVKEGRFISYLLAQFPELTMYAVDAWEDQPDGIETYEEWDWGSIYRDYRKKTAPYRNRVRELWLYSVEASKKIEDQSLDFVFIDAQHDYESVKQDIQLWRPKVKPGGLLCGHDYDHKFPSAVKAVDEMIKNPKVTTNSVWYCWID